MLPQNKPDRIRILFDDHRTGGQCYGLLLPATLARCTWAWRENSSTITLNSRRSAGTGERVCGTRC